MRERKTAESRQQKAGTAPGETALYPEAVHCFLLSAFCLLSHPSLP
jgi:hypothetical protein